MPKRILVIESDDELREFIGSALEQDGYEVTTVDDSVRGYNNALFLRPDLIVTDTRPSDADATYIVRRVRDSTSIENTPILVTTAFGSGTATYSLQLGATS